MDHENQRGEDGVNAGEHHLPPADPQVEDPRHAAAMTVVIRDMAQLSHRDMNERLHVLAQARAAHLVK